MTPVAAPLRVVERPASVASGAVPPASGFSRKIVLQTASAADADAIAGLITDHLVEGHLLPRERDEIMVRASRFVVARQADLVFACAELAPLSRSVAEVRSLVVGRGARRRGVGRTIVDELRRRAEAAGFERLCAFTHAPAYFVHMGFSIVPHVWLPEKILTDCHSCRHFRQCGQYAVEHTLGRSRDSYLPLTALHG
jgi:N-acetylglutamate synthase-like GNAT family acetyltransferase